MTSDLEAWMGGSAPGTVEQLHAVGAFAMYYNDLELALYGFFRRYLPENRDARAFLFTNLHNRARADLISTFLNREPDAELREGAIHALKCFDICAENRNLLLHAISQACDPVTGELKVVKIGKGDRGAKPGKSTEYRFSLAHIRTAALDMRACEGYIALLLARPSSPLATLPERPRLPRKLSLSRLPATPPAE